MPRVLLIEDDEALRATLRRTLQRAGYETLDAPNGRAVSNLLAASHVDLVITDIVMPEVEGIEVIMSLRKTHPTLPVLAMSGGGRTSTDDYLSVAQALGAVAVLAKPFETDRFLEVVRGLIGRPEPAPPTL